MLENILDEQFIISAGKGKEATIHFEVIKKKKFMVIAIDKERTMLDFNELWAALFMFSSDKQQEKMIPVKKNVVRYLQRIIEITAAKDIRRGDKIRFNYEFKIPEEMFVQENNPMMVATTMNQVKLKQEARDIIK